MRPRILLPLTAALALSAPAAASADYPHMVSAGESLYSIAAADGLSVAQVAAANGLSPSSQLITGAIVQIPPAGAGSGSVATGTSGAAAPASSSPSAGDGDADSDDGSAGAAAAAPASTASSGYTVQPGDTLSVIAARAGTSVAGLAAANGLDPNALLLAGSVISVSGAPASSASAGSSAAATQPIGAAAQGSASGGPYPTAETVTASQVGSIASANGVSPSLAAAIGWQESGFNNALVSSADARGVMQILPGTWDWIQRTLTAGTSLAPASAADNVRGGVLMLHSLLSATGGDPALAAAGYYQGLGSVRQNGMYADTQQYVNTVLALRQRFGGP